jgi:Raf kinase inhibitor-like YbhB/YbcL family protein
MQGFEWAERNFNAWTPDELQARGVNVYYAPNIEAERKVVNLANGRVENFWCEERRPESGYYADFESLARYCRSREIALVETDGVVSTLPAGRYEAGDPLPKGRAGEPVPEGREGEPVTEGRESVKAGGLPVTSDAFSEGELIPPKYTCEGLDVSPQIYWGPPPVGTRSIAVLMTDPDAPGGSFTHWLVYDLPTDMTALPEGVPEHQDLPPGAESGLNSFGKKGYNGPCPPRGDDPHRYVFHVYALDTRLALPPRAPGEAFERAVQGHVLAEGQLTGIYARRS